MPPLFTQYDAVFFDLDGVVYAGAGAVPGAVQALAALAQQGIPCAYITNNASRSEAEVAAHLNSLGIAAEAAHVFGSAATGVDLLREHAPAGARVFVAGSPYLASLVERAGFGLVTLEEAESGTRADAVVQGFDPDLTWRHLAQASYAVHEGALWIATNLDGTIPRAEGIAPGNGSLVQAVCAATGKQPLSAGKPQPAIFQRAARALGVRRPLMVGDRLDTDIAGANAAGLDSALVLTGIDSAAGAEAAPVSLQPTYIIRGLGDLLSRGAQEVRFLP